MRSCHHARVDSDPEDVLLERRHPARRLKQYFKACGEALALAHSRGECRSTRFEAAIVARLVDNEKSLLAGTYEYVQQVVAHWDLLRQMLAQPR